MKGRRKLSQQRLLNCGKFNLIAKTAKNYLVICIFRKEISGKLLISCLGNGLV